VSLSFYEKRKKQSGWAIIGGAQEERLYWEQWCAQRMRRIPIRSTLLRLACLRIARAGWQPGEGRGAQVCEPAAGGLQREPGGAEHLLPAQLCAPVPLLTLSERGRMCCHAEPTSVS